MHNKQCTRNESGRFYYDENGLLTLFIPEWKNLVQNTQPEHAARATVRIKNLVIPDTIHQLGQDEYGWDGERLTEMFVTEKMELPQGIEKLGGSILSQCEIMEMELPATLRQIGGGALMNSYFHTLRIPQGLPYPHTYYGIDPPSSCLYCSGRQFKQSIIDTLYVPEGYPYKLLMPEAKINNVVLTNSCGAFWTDKDGKLQYFECTPENCGKSKPEYANEDYDPECHIIRLDVPEGITVMPETFDFYKYTIDEVTFPKSLRVIEESVFDTCVIGTLVMPESVEEYTGLPFSYSRVQRLVIPDSATAEQIDRFMETALSGCGFPVITPFARVSHLPAHRLPLRKITNTSGTFWIDAEGVLRNFECAEGNHFSPLSNPCYRNEKHLNWLEIPEWVTVLPAGAFDGYQIFMETKLPDSLTALGDPAGGVFRHCSFSHPLELPKGITFVGEDSFFMSRLDTIQLCDDMDALTVQKLRYLFCNHTYHSFLFYPAEKIRYLPPLKIDTIQLRNESGTFYVDKLGVLQDFCCSPENNADSCSEQNARKLYTLHIPEGVTVLKENAFRDYTILYKMTLPESLRLMGTGCGNVFSGCSLPDVVIPDKLETLGTFAFGCSVLRSLSLPKNKIWGYARQFKSASIGTLYLSEKYREESNDPDLCFHIAGYGYMRSLRVNNVRIGKIVWLE